ncbi:BLUF domain-containing protein [Asticcacaulis sp. 201]|uniref:BLUF domain-containing protein n=1 Tax=Asticcacaulis sp. 201 TaxID=3028787 RepID=UPI002916CA2F|nr:BLUF domain-containing protein [Asticcacaulis sp. 201]MDV6331021.1 BLUF domain-containing protein [Asticcacaulis sp. 201]
MLVRCLYASRLTSKLSASLLSDILDQSRRNNPARGITGLLCHTQSVFVQVLEGDREQVSILLAKLMQDDRHQAVTVLLFEEIAERAFSGWTMGQVNIDLVNPGLLLKYFPQPKLDPFTGTGRTAMAFLMELVATGAIGA